MRYCIGTAHNSKLYALLDLAVLDMHEVWLSLAGACLTREVISPESVICWFAWDAKSDTLSYWWHRDVRACGIVPTGGTEDSWKSALQFLEKHGPPVNINLNLLTFPEFCSKNFDSHNCCTNKP